MTTSQKVKATVTVVLVALVTFLAVYFLDDSITIGPVEGELPDISIGEAASDLLLSLGVSPFISALIDVCKLWGWLPEKTAGKVNLIGNALAYIVISIAQRGFGIDPASTPLQRVMEVGVLALQTVIAVSGAWLTFQAARAIQLQRLRVGVAQRHTKGLFKPLPGRPAKVYR